MSARGVLRMGLLVGACLAGRGGGAAICADAPATATAPATAARTEEVVFKEMGEVRKANSPIPAFGQLCDADFRTKNAERLREPLVKMAQLTDEVSAFEPKLSMSPRGGSKVMFQGQRVMYLAMAAALGNKDAAAQLATLAAGSDKETSAKGKIGQCLVAWLQADDAAARGKVLDGIEALGKEHPSSEAIASGLATIRSIRGLPADQLARIDAIFLKTLTGDVATGVQAMLDAGGKQKDAVGKPLTLAGKTLDGKDFSTKEYAGKVVLVDFWATWCGPCVAELPHVKELYEKYHDQGLEIVGVSSDGSAGALAKYIKEKNLPWVQLWDKDKQGGDRGEAWHPLAAEWKLNGIPQMFLIDRQGVLRTVEARKTLDEMIPKLLDEKAK